MSSVEASIQLLEAKANGKEATMAYAKNTSSYKYTKHITQRDMVIDFAAEGDNILNPHITWKEEKKLVAAKLRVTAAFPESQGNCDTMNFDPLVLSKGFKASEDPKF